MAKYVCSSCGTECSTTKADEIPQSIFWSDGHACTWVLATDPIQVEVIQLRAEMEELKANLNPDDASTAYGKMKIKIDTLEMALRESLGDKFLKKYGNT